MKQKLLALMPLLRWVITLGLIGYLISSMDWHPLVTVFTDFTFSFYLAGVCTMAVYVLIQGYILSQLLRSRNLQIGVVQMVRYCVISSFFGIFLPGGSGADAVMIVRLCRDSKDRAGVVAAIMYTRVASIMALMILAFFVSIVADHPVPGVTLVTGIVSGLFLLFVTLNALGILGTIKKWMLGRWTRFKVIRFGDRVLDALSQFGVSRNLATIIPSFFSLALGKALMDYFMARSLDLHLSFPLFIIFATVVSLTTMLPISIAGLGVREVTFTGLFALVGVPTEVAVSISLLSFSLTLIVCFCGGIIYGIGKRAPDESCS